MDKAAASLIERIASPREEVANAITHAVGLLLSVIGAPILVIAALACGDLLTIVGASVFGASLIVLYTTSTLYHAISHHVTKSRLRLLDHIAIYLLIAGTYTPFTVGVLRGAWGWTMFGAVWSMAAIGVFAKVRFRFRNERISTFMYLLMGWVIVIAIRPLVASMHGAGVALLVAGGVLYSAGVVFYRQKRSWSHPVWHLFVMAGSACHYFAVLWYSSLPTLPR